LIVIHQTDDGERWVMTEMPRAAGKPWPPDGYVPRVATQDELLVKIEAKVGHLERWRRHVMLDGVDGRNEEPQALGVLTPGASD
jgi:hypothetical protein